MRKILVILIFLSLVISCKKETGVKGATGAEGPAGASGSADTGTIAGNVSLYNEFSYNEDSAGGVIVTLISGDLILKDTTKNNGNYQFHGLETGTYNFQFTKNGYGEMKTFGVSHFAGALPTNVIPIDLIQIPVKTAINSFTGALNGNYYIFYVGLDTSSLTYVQNDFLLCVGKDPQVSSTNNVKVVNNIFFPDGNGAYTLSFARGGLSGVFNTGDTMYVRGYTYNRFLHPTNLTLYYSDPGQSAFYIDPNTGYTIYPNLSPSSLLKLVW